ncbi:MAG: hypothetical protein WD044_10520 [Dongiaceae bacterium]
MLTGSEIVRSVYGMWRLARLDTIGLQWLDRSPDGFWRSFRLAALLLPAFALHVYFDLSDSAITASLPRILAIQGIYYIVAWTAFPVLMHPIAVALGREERYIGYIVALNWSQVIQYGVLLPVETLIFLGNGGGIGAFLGVVVFFALSVYLWFIAKTALDIHGTTAAGLVVLDILISQVNYLSARAMLA